METNHCRLVLVVGLGTMAWISGCTGEPNFSDYGAAEEHPSSQDLGDSDPPSGGTGGGRFGGADEENDPGTQAEANGAASPVLPCTVDEDEDGWESLYSEPESLANDLSLSTHRMEGTDPVEGPGPGSLKCEIPFNGAGQKVQIGRILPSEENLRNVELAMAIRLDSGCSESTIQHCGAKLYVKSGDLFVWAEGRPVNLSGDWQPLSIRPDTPDSAEPGYDPAKVVEFGIEIYTNSRGEAVSAQLHVNGCATER